jgi:hypothetical protein
MPVHAHTCLQSRVFVILTDSVNELVSSRRWGTDSVNGRFLHGMWASVNLLGTPRRNRLREWTRTIDHTRLHQVCQPKPDAEHQCRGEASSSAWGQARPMGATSYRAKSHANSQFQRSHHYSKTRPNPEVEGYVKKQFPYQVIASDCRVTAASYPREWKKIFGTGNFKIRLTRELYEKTTGLWGPTVH